ncbi:MAG: septal ring lytic transglycosylase RlpA family protein [Rhodospirillales bacterium]|nr:septal ring lytic transglycosylase RlpA family protein [Rhodospirillales bacterium]
MREVWIPALAVLAVFSAGVRAEDPAVAESGEASVYSDRFEGRETAGGDRFDQDKLTAAHKKLPLGTEAKVVNENNGRSVEVEINDRGPYAAGRVIDLSKAAARELGIKDGDTPVKVEVPRQKIEQQAEGK